MTTSTIARPATSSRTRLLQGAAATAGAAVLLPRLNAVIYDDQPIWHVDPEAAVLIPVMIAVTLLLFAGIGSVSLRGNRNRPALTSVAVGIASLVGVLGFWISAPIILGGLAATLGIEGRHRSATQGRRRSATYGVVLGLLGVAAGAAMWMVGV